MWLTLLVSPPILAWFPHSLPPPHQVSAFTFYVLAYELLFGQGLGGHRRRGPAEKAVLKVKVSRARACPLIPYSTPQVLCMVQFEDAGQA